MVLCQVVFFGIMYCFVQRKMEGTYIRKNELIISGNKAYIGIIDEDNKQVRIISHSGNEISHFDINYKGEERVHQIALGDTSYFLLYLNWNDAEDSAIVQYDYHSNKMKEYIMSDIATIACRNGYLFMGRWNNVTEDGEIYPDYYFYPVSDGFYAHMYVKEKDFGSPPESLTSDRNGCCLVDNVKMYYHREGYYSMEPELEDYPGTSWGDFRASDKEIHYEVQTRQEEKNRKLVLKMAEAEEDVNDPVCEIYEYQVDNLIYGVCNVYSVWIPSQPTKMRNVAKSYYYWIDPAKNEIMVLGETEKSLAIAGSGSSFVYQKGEEIIRENVRSGEKEVIYRIKNTWDLYIYVNGDYLLVVEKEKMFFLDSSTVKKAYYPVRWKD